MEEIHNEFHLVLAALGNWREEQTQVSSVPYSQEGSAKLERRGQERQWLRDVGHHFPEGHAR